MLLILLTLISYLIGSISSAIIVCRIMGLPDPRSSGSNNPGTTNVLRLGGKKAAILTLFGDVIKGVIPVVLAKLLTGSPIIIAMAGLAAFLGHLYPIFFNFKGGKGVATAAGVFIGLSGFVMFLLFIIWLITAVAFRYSSLAALIAVALTPFIVIWALPGLPYFLLALVIAVFVFLRHKENIKRLIAGEESKINFRRS
ncbi:MAG: glycerol-3-phosphate 1-O-acyltransferase PlsY [Gammaproteobacteria bacterium]|nr:glycerol-3-phosphate 1-O-acyltransferase PlsY [Gammaproteobacteria bacterium]